MQNMRLMMLLIGATFAGAFVLGCSSGSSVHQVDVTGKVTIDGEPVPRGTITFVAEDGQTPTGGGIIEEGNYIAKVPPGDKIVMVLGNKLVGQEPEFDTPGSAMRNVYETVTPPAYNAEHLTPLRATITESQENLDFELSKKVTRS